MSPSCCRCDKDRRPKRSRVAILPVGEYSEKLGALLWEGLKLFHFVIADAIVCMEGNGPPAGTARRLDRIVVSDDPVAADGTCARLMGLTPERVPHIAEAAKFLGNMASDRIDQVAALVAFLLAHFARSKISNNCVWKPVPRRLRSGGLRVGRYPPGTRSDATRQVVPVALK